MKKEKLGQVWIETVVYTLIGLVLIGMVLAFALPVVEVKKDERVFLSTVDALNTIDNKITEIYNLGPSNKRNVPIAIGKGQLVIESNNDLSGGNDRLVFVIEDSAYAASEYERSVEIEIDGTNLKVKTVEKGDKNYEITIVREYPSARYNLTYDMKDILHTLNSASGAYNLEVVNRGRNNMDIVDLS